MSISYSEKLCEWSSIRSLADEGKLVTLSERQLVDLPQILQSVVHELLDLKYSNSRATATKRKTHVRQVVIYVLNVNFGIPMRQLAKMFNLNRSTIAYTCQTIEDRRDNPNYDRFVSAVERIAMLTVARYV
ncbi:hypothetical protein AB2J24_08250 [Lentilitoribacter sp. EG35]